MTERAKTGMTPADSTARFSNRVADYIKYRPGYPDALVQTIVQRTGLTPGWNVADVGSGTGISTAVFLERGCTVWAVEPNEAMRRAAEDRFVEVPGFRSVDGRAEATTLADASCDLVAAGQAFHWFDFAAARDEFRRISRPAAWLALFWNNRANVTPFMDAYEALLQGAGTDYAQVRHESISPSRLREFFGADLTPLVFPNEQLVDYDGLRGRLMSSSYVPPESDPRAEPMLQQLRSIFDRHQDNGRVRIVYETKLYLSAIVDLP